MLPLPRAGVAADGLGSIGRNAFKKWEERDSWGWGVPHSSRDTCRDLEPSGMGGGTVPTGTAAVP